MSETPVDIPTSKWEWLLADKRRLAALVAGAVLALALIGVFVVRPLLLDGRSSARHAGIGPLSPIDGIPPAEDSTSAPGAADNGAAGGIDSDGQNSDASDGANDADGPEHAASHERAPYVAYRLEGAIWVAREDGTRPVSVADSENGAFALSPDATMLAIVESGELALVTVATGSRTVVGEAELHGLAWHADSSALLFLRSVPDTHGVTEIHRVSRRGGEVAKVLRAGEPAVAADGTVAAPSIVTEDPPADPTRGSLWVIEHGKTAKQLGTRGHPGACDVERGRVVYAVLGMRYKENGDEKQIRPEIWVMSSSGRDSRRLVGPPATERPFGYGNLMLSPDGSRLLFAEVGDDGFSRARVVALDGGGAVSLTVRRDTYPAGWSADGKRVLFVEGNAFQGERTSLMSALVDGSGRQMVVAGAGL